MLTTLVLGVAVVAFMFGASVAYVATSARTARWRGHRASIRAWRWALRELHSGHVDALPRTGGPPDPTGPRPHIP